MNDIDSHNNKKESNFKVYKDKLSSFIPGFGSKKDTEKIKKNTPFQNNNPTKFNTNSENKPITSNKKPKQTQPPSLDEIRQKIRSQAIKKEEPSKDTLSLKPNVSQMPPKSKDLKPNGGILKIVIKVVIITLIALIVAYIIVNYQALSLRFNYWYNVSIEHKNWSELHPVTLHKAQNTAQKLDENYLYIPTLGIQAPINWGVSEDDVSGMLSSGLVQYKVSALPDDAQGDIYIIGNTSGPIWSSSPYKTVFTLLDKVKPDHVVTIIYDNKIYSYRITEIEYLGNSKITITPGETEQSELNLLARYLIGINWKTLRVRAELFKIESNVAESIQDKVNQLEEVYNEAQVETELEPIEVKPTPTAVPIPIDNQIPNPELLPQHFLPEL